MSEGSKRQPSREELVAAVEAVIFAAGEPVRAEEIVAAFDEVEEESVLAALDALERSYDERIGGLRLERVAGGFRLATHPAAGAWVRRFFRVRNRARLSAAALETLAIVAYKQPTTSPEIQAIRGVDPSASLKSLLDKKLIRILGRKKVVGNPLLYGTTKHFLVHFGLDSLSDLPSVEEFDALVGALEFGEPLAETEGAGEEGPSEPPASPGEEGVGDD